MWDFIDSIRFACRGIADALFTEPHLRIHGVAAALVVMLGTMLGLPAHDLLLLLVAIALVLITELLNTAVELAVDVASPTFHPVAKRAKDIAAGAVLVAAITSAVIGGAILAPHLLRVLLATPFSARSASLGATALGLGASILTALWPRQPGENVTNDRPPDEDD